MKALKRLALVALVVLIVPFAGEAANAEEQKPGLFVNLTTDDTWSAAKAIFFAHQKALKNGYKPVTIWLNVRGVYLADKNRPSHTHGLTKKSIHEMLQDFIKDGGTVFVCQACSKAAGLTEQDLIEGVVMGEENLILPALFGKEVRTLSW
ncbi:MAG: DsrE family protein [Rhodospirillales bacterium]|nr:DsrE family protein [Rhodospirillales bacterium]